LELEFMLLSRLRFVTLLRAFAVVLMSVSLALPAVAVAASQKSERKTTQKSERKTAGSAAERKKRPQVAKKSARHGQKELKARNRADSKVAKAGKNRRADAKASTRVAKSRKTDARVASQAHAKKGAVRAAAHKRHAGSMHTVALKSAPASTGERLGLRSAGSQFQRGAGGGSGHQRGAASARTTRRCCRSPR
jgi:hypothetical protein